MSETDFPVVGTINRRLRDAREELGLAQTVWHARLIRDGFEISLSSVRNYEQPTSASESPTRMPPADYIAQVSKVFGLKPKWLLFGLGPMSEDKTPPDDAKGDDPEFESLLFGGESLAVVKGVPWLKSSQVRIPFLHLLEDCVKAAPGAGRPEKDEIRDLLAALFNLPSSLPGAEKWISSAEDLAPWERSLLAQQLTSLTYLLFVPFREAHGSFTRSQTLRGGGRLPQTCE